MGEFDYAAKIEKLLRKAEGNTTPEERDSLISKAQQLMSLYSITEAMLAAKQPEEREPIIQKDIVLTGIFQRSLLTLAYAVVTANTCRGVYRQRTHPKPTAQVLTVTGFRSDVERVEVLATSLQVQVAVALNAWWKANDYGWLSKMEQFKTKRDFIDGFVAGVSSKLYEARRVAEKQAAEAHATDTGLAADVATKEVGLALRSRKDQVNDWVDKKYGTLRHGRSRNTQGGYGNGTGAGYAAGRSADTGQSRVGGSNRGELGA